MSCSSSTSSSEAPRGGFRDWSADYAKLRGDFRLFAIDRCAVCGGPLFGEDEKEEGKKEEGKKQGGKKEKKKDKKDKKERKCEDDECEPKNRRKKPLKKSKSVMRFLSKGKSKATNLLDDLQYEGDELKRKKATREKKRRDSKDHRAEEDDEDQDSDSDSEMQKDRQSGRVSSEPKLQDRRGRVPPTRSRTMTAMPTHTSKSLQRSTSARTQPPSRIICRYCERGERRPTWEDDRQSSLEENASLSSLFHELCEEKELIISLTTRYEYLICSVSDVGDLLIELFTPQLKEDAPETEAERRESGGNDGPVKELKASKSKSNFVTGEWQGLSLTKLFGWNDKKNANTSGATSSSEDSDSQLQRSSAKNQRKVMALLPSCYCTSKKVDKYETFFPEFHYDVYRAAEGLEKELTMTADTYKSALKLFARLKSTIQSPRQERVIANMKIAFVEFIQEKQPELNWLKLKRKNLVLCQASYLFLVMCQLLWEIRKKQSLWLKISKYFLATIQVMQSELASLAISSHKEWNDHKKRIEEIITEYNKLKAEKAINSVPENTKLSDDQLLLNCEWIVRECVKQVEFNLGETCMRATKDSLVELIANLVLERAKS